MKKKIAASFIMMALVCTMIGGATFAYFTDKLETDSKVFNAGIVDIDDSSSPDLWFPNTFDCSRMVPGDKFHGEFMIQNSSNVPIYYKVVPVCTGELWANINDPTAVALAGLYLSSLDANKALTPDEFGNAVLGGPSDTPFNKWIMVPTSRQNPIDVDFSVIFPKESGNKWQNKAGNVKFKLTAIQAKNIIVKDTNNTYPGDPLDSNSAALSPQEIAALDAAAVSMAGETVWP